jgi:hypothetical protein
MAACTTLVICYMFVVAVPSAAMRVPLAMPAAGAPDLSGHWRRLTDDAITDEASKVRVDRAADAFCGSECEITQGAHDLVVVRDQFPDKPRLVFVFGETDGHNQFMMPTGLVRVTSRVTVSESGIEIASLVSRGDITSRQEMTVSVVDKRLVVVRHVLGRAPGTVRRQTYVAK